MPPDPARKYPGVRHCEEAAIGGRRGNLLPLAREEPLIFLGATESQFRLVGSFLNRCCQIGTRGYAND